MQQCLYTLIHSHTHTVKENIWRHIFKPSTFFSVPFFRLQIFLNKLINKDYHSLFSLFCDKNVLSPSIYQQMPWRLSNKWIETLQRRPINSPPNLFIPVFFQFLLIHYIYIYTTSNSLPKFTCHYLSSIIIEFYAICAL